MSNNNKNRHHLGITCLICDKLLSKYIEQTDSYSPTCEELLASGFVPVPNCGWFCSQSCASGFELKYNVKFQRNLQLDDQVFKQPKGQK